VTCEDRAIASAIALFVAGLLSAGCDPKAAPESEVPEELLERQAPVEIAIRDGDRVVWLGDSITHHAQYTQYLETFFVTRFPRWELEFRNAGLAGDRAGDVLKRYPDDEFASQADLAVLLLGMNDGGFRRYRDEIGETFRNDLSTLLDRIVGNGARTLLVSPTVYDVEAEWRDQLRDGEPVGYGDPKLLGYDAVMDRFREIARALSAERNLAFVDVRGPLLEQMKKDRIGDASSSLIPDSLHPSPSGHAIMAVTILREAFGDFPPVSDVEIVVNADDPAAPWVVCARNAVLSESASTTDENGISSLTFRLLETSLPWLVPDEAKRGFAAANGDDFNRQFLKIQGLPNARFALSIDESVLGVFTSTALEIGVDLGKSSYSPQREHAAVVAELNRQRNSGPVRSMQDWRVDYRNRLAAIAVTPDQAEKAQLQAQLDEWLPTFEQALGDLDGQADDFWQKINEAAQPVAHIYRLQRLPESYRPFGDGE